MCSKKVTQGRGLPLLLVGLLRCEEEAHLSDPCDMLTATLAPKAAKLAAAWPVVGSPKQQHVSDQRPML